MNIQQIATPEAGKDYPRNWNDFLDWFSYRGHQRAGCRLRYPVYLHQPLAARVVAGHLLDHHVAARYALVQPAQLIDQIVHHLVEIALQILQVLVRHLAHRLRLLWHHDALLGQQASYPIDRRRALIHKPLAHPVHRQPTLLLHALDRHEPHRLALHGFADRRRIGRVVLLVFASVSVRRHQLGRHQPSVVPKFDQLPRPFVGARARLHANQARGQCGKYPHQIPALDARLPQHHCPRLIDAMHRKNILARSMPTAAILMDFPFRANFRWTVHTSHLGALTPFAKLSLG
jgi:hypothetical protein